MEEELFPRELLWSLPSVVPGKEERASDTAGQNDDKDGQNDRGENVDFEKDLDDADRT